MEPRAGFCFQADSFAIFCFASGGKVFGGGCESSRVPAGLEGQRGSLALSFCVPPSQLGQGDRGVPGWAVHSSGCPLTPSLP